MGKRKAISSNAASKKKKCVAKSTKKGIFFSAIPTNLQMAILMKLPNEPLCQLRRTCSYLDNFIHENGGKLSRRNMKGVCISLYGEDNEISKYNKKTLHTIKFDKLDNVDERYVNFTINSPFERFLSGVVIEELQIRYQFNWDFVKTFVERSKISCKVLDFVGRMSAKQFVEITDLVDCREIHLLHAIRFGNESLPLLTSAKNASKTKIPLAFLPDIKYVDYFEEYKKFRGVIFLRIDSHEFENMMRLLYNSSDIGHLKNMEFQLGFGHDPLEDPSQPLPPMTQLWNRSSVPKQYFKKSRFIEPFTIRSMDLPQTPYCAICASKSEKIKRVYFEKKDRKTVFEILMKLLVIPFDEEQEKKFLEIAEEEQMENVIREIFKVQQVKRVL